MTNDECITLAVRNGWAPLKDTRLEGIPAFRRGDSTMWRHLCGVTVADTGVSVNKGVPNAVKYSSHRFYASLEAAIKAEGPDKLSILNDL